ncbi:hypothetical protein EDB83DRAFT_2339951 [Lactarius deliciosus]|nr:hypothetical protein EDB83DRAFT_2339951 [Lactarius deliciosus]
MGFFSSRRHDTDVFLDASSQHLGSSPSPGVIRSRFYGRNKGKSREASATLPQGAIPSPAHSRGEPSFNDSPSTFSGRRSTKGSDMRSASESPILSSPHKSPASTRASTDAITMMLSQRLAELASANAEGLLDDDEYRLLRQNLFERLGNSTVPQENPVVPTAGPSRPRPPGTPQRKDSTRAPSVQSKGTTSSSISGFLRRATGRRNASADTDPQSDSTSFLSASSNSPNAFTRRLLRLSSSKQSSTASLRADTAASASDGLSLVHASSNSASPSISRSSTTRSKRRAPPPPSSFHHRSNGAEPKRMQTHSAILDDDVDDGELKSSKEIRAQIEAVEAEGRRTHGCFQRALIPLIRHGRSAHRRTPTGCHCASTTSNGTSHRSPVRTPRTLPNPPLVSQPILLGRKGRSGPTNGAPHLPALPSSRHLPLAPVAEGDSRESVEGHVRTTTPVSSRKHEVVGDEGDMIALERRRTEVMGRYDERLGYLRAKLKGAELHEKLLRR